jgi:hypothetical protein
MTVLRSARPDLAVNWHPLQKMIGKIVRFKGRLETDGQIHREGIFKIVGVQRDYRRHYCFRVACINFKGQPYRDNFGQVMPLDRVKEAQ